MNSNDISPAANTPLEKKLIKAVLGLIPLAESEVDTLIACQKDDESAELAREVEVGQQRLDFADATLHEAFQAREHFDWLSSAKHGDVLCARPAVAKCLQLDDELAGYTVSRYTGWAKEFIANDPTD